MSCSDVNYSDLIGCKFKVHGRNKEEGFDCWGVGIEIYKRDGIILYDPFYETLDNSEDVYEKIFNSLSLEKLENPVEKCIILISVNGRPTHIGVYIGQNMMIHARKDVGVIAEPISRWKPRIVGYYKVNN